CAGPATRVTSERVPRLLPPVPPVAGARARQPSRRAGALRARELVPADAYEVRGPARAHDERDQRHDAQRGTDAERPERESPSKRNAALAREQSARERDHDRGAGGEERGEDPAVV